METIKFVNKNLIAKIIVKDFSKCSDYVYVPERWTKGFWPFINPKYIEAHWHKLWSGNDYTREEVLEYEYLTIINNTVFMRPSVHIMYSSKHMYNDDRYFDTRDDALNFVQDLIRDYALDEFLIELPNE